MRILIILTLTFLITACGPSSDEVEVHYTCSGTSFNTYPSTTAYVGYEYSYSPSASYSCQILFTCHNILPVTLPDGAYFNDVSYDISWTPTTVQDASFEIKTGTDSCGTSATQSWTVHVYPAPPDPVINRFEAIPSSIVLQESVRLEFDFQNGSGEIWELLPRGVYSKLSDVMSGESYTSDSLFRPTQFRLIVRNPAGAEVNQDITIPITGLGTFAFTKGDPAYSSRLVSSATRLLDGRVFFTVVGSSYTEIFDPVTETFAAGPVMNEKYYKHTAALLPNGRVLVVGDNMVVDNIVDVYDNRPSAEIFNPSNNTMVSIGPLPADRLINPISVKLSDDRILIIGGYETRGTALIFNPTTETFKLVDSFDMLYSVYRAYGIVRLPYGRVLLIDGSSYEQSQIFSASTDTFTLTDNLTLYRTAFASATLLDGRALITGGGVEEAEVYNPVTDVYSLVGSSQQLSAYADTATTLSDGRVLIAGGGNYLGWAELFSPITNTFSITGGLNVGRQNSTATLLDDGRVLIVGGCPFSPCKAELYTPP